jgi:hypothetical protein
MKCGFTIEMGEKKRREKYRIYRKWEEIRLRPKFKK